MAGSLSRNLLGRRSASAARTAGDVISRRERAAASCVQRAGRVAPSSVQGQGCSALHVRGGTCMHPDLECHPIPLYRTAHPQEVIDVNLSGVFYATQVRRDMGGC